MPEGPEIRLAADRLERVLVGRPLTSVTFARPDLMDYAPALQASTITKIRTKGKALLTEFDCGLTVYSHNQLYGRWYVVKCGHAPRTRRSLRWAISTREHDALLYSASDIEVLPSENVGLHPFVARAGMDLLSDRPDITELRRYVEQPKFARRALGHLLLDQSFIAGIGNYLRSEILFCAGMLPEVRLKDLDGHATRRFAKHALAVTQRSYQTGGITNDEACVARLKAAGWRRARYRHYVFARAGQACHRCRTKIQKIAIAGRRLYYCPECQTT